MPRERKNNHWRWGIAIFLMALLVRSVWGAYRYTRADDPAILEFPDEEQYWSMAGSLWSGEGLRDELGFQATRMPLFPAVLSVFHAIPNGLLAAKTLLWFVGALAAAATTLAATALFDRRIGIIAGLLVAFDPFLIFFSSLLLSETPYVTALAVLWWTLWPLTRRDPIAGQPARWIAVGLLSALCVYLRESSIGLIVFSMGFVLVCRRCDGKSVAGSALVLGVVIAALIPWAARNRAVTGDWCWLTHRAGISLYDGVGPQATGASDLGDVKQSEAVRGLNEVAWNRYFLDQAVGAIKHDPGRVIRLAGVKLKRMWNPIPNVETYRSGAVRWLSAAWTIPTFALAAVAALLLFARGGENRRAALFLLVPAVYFSGVHSLFVGSVRYRLAAIPMIEVLAAVSLAAIYQKIRQHGTRKAK